MIYIKENTKERIKNWTDDSIHILTDFDKTITIGHSDSSWGILTKSNLMHPDYSKDRQELLNYYRPIEIDESIDLETRNITMVEWWNKHMGLFVKYQLPEDIVKEAAKSTSVMIFREGAKDFLKNMHDRGIPIIIISAGVGNFIEQFLINNNCYYDNIHIVSNFIKFTNGIASGSSENVVHSLNKNEASLPEELKEIIENRPNIILLGDSLSDIRMVSPELKENALKIGFLEENLEENLPKFKEQFDIVGTDNASYIELLKEIQL